MVPLFIIMKKNIAVDVDGVLAEYSGWKGFDHIGDPLLGAREFLIELRKKYRVVIFTTKCNVERNLDNLPYEVRYNAPMSMDPMSGPKDFLEGRMKEWLKQHNMPYDEIYVGQGKPICMAIVDDRAVNCQPQSFPGAFADALRQIDRLDGMYYKKRKGTSGG